MARSAGGGRGAGRDLQGQYLRTFTLITNTLAKDKEISDRWRGFEDIADSRHLANRVERGVVDALAAAVREAYPRLSHRYYAMKARWLGMDADEPLGPQRARCPRRRRRRSAGTRRSDTVLSAYRRLLARHGRDRARASSTRAGSTRRSSRQGAGRLRASDRALRASLCAAQLPGQAARRDDARPRARATACTRCWPAARAR
jgi:hypothetical protein